MKKNTTPKPNGDLLEAEDSYAEHLRVINLLHGRPADSPPPPPASPTKTEPLKGFYFHQFHDGHMHWQGVILRQWADYVLVLVFNCLDGSPSCCHLVKESELLWNSETRTGFMLYPDHHLFIQSYSEIERKLSAINGGQNDPT
jgi:hypothetical protein